MYIYPFLDISRRWLGREMDALGLGPVETPSRVVLARPGVTLKGYAPPDAEGPVLLLVPAPIKQAYLWDLAPEISVVRRCLDAGLRVYLAQWEPPGKHEQEFGLGQYADQLINKCAEAIEAETGQDRVLLAGHSLGGTLAAIFASLHPSRVAGLILLDAPTRFASDTNSLSSAVTAVPNTRLMTTATGNVPGSFLSSVSLAADPVTYGMARWMDWLESWPDPVAMRTYLRVSRWTLDEMAMPRRLFTEVIDWLYREDRFMRAELEINGRPALPWAVDSPVLSVADPYSRVVPPDSALTFHTVAGNEENRVLWYDGDVGVALQHAGLLVGRRAHHAIWPEILEWAHAVAEEQPYAGAQQGVQSS